MGGDRATRANDVEFQKIEPFKVRGYVSVWLLTTPEGNTLFDSTQEPDVDCVIGNIRKVGVDPKSIKDRKSGFRASRSGKKVRIELSQEGHNI